MQNTLERSGDRRHLPRSRAVVRAMQIMVNQIQIPEDAPFSAAQRQWLEQFLAQVLSGQGPGAAAGPLVPVTILYGTQTGNAGGCAKKLAKAMRRGAFETKVCDMREYERSSLADEKNLLVITSTYGDGEPPDGALGAKIHASISGKVTQITDEFIQIEK